MNTFIFYEPKQALKLKNQKKTVSTLRIPFELKETLKKGILRHGNLEKYLRILLQKYRFLFYGNLFEPSSNAKTEYQKRGEKYLIYKFRPELRDWLELGMWADSLGISRCFLFAKLLEIEKENEFFVSSRSFRKYSYVLTTPYYARIPQLKKDLRKGRSIYERGITFYDPPG